MIFKELKQVENLTEKDIIFSNIAHLSKLTTKVTDKVIEVLKKGQVNYIPVIKQSEKTSFETIANEINEQILENELNSLKENLIEEIKDIFKPFTEEDKIFTIQGKKHLLKLNELMQTELEQMYWGEILEGSLKILPKHKITSIQKILFEIYKYFDTKKIRILANLSDKKVLKKLYLYSVRRDYEFVNDTIRNDGDSVLLHAVDTTIYFLIIIANLNKIRSLKNSPRSTAKFYLDKTEYNEFTEFFYVDEVILQAALGVLLHPIGLMHKTILKELGDKISIKSQNLEEEYKSKIENLEKNINISRNLFRNRDDVSAITKMMINSQKDFLDITGYPDPKTNKFTHELIRIFQIIDTYDELVNPIIMKEPVNALEATYFLAENSSKYLWNKEKPNEYMNNKKLDIEMLKHFFVVLAPFDYGQVLYIYKKNTDELLFIVTVYSYKMGVNPVFSVLKQKDTSYNPGDILMDFEAKEILIKGQDGQYKKTPLKNINNFDIKNNIKELQKDEIKLVIFNKERKYNPINISSY